MFYFEKCYDIDELAHHNMHLHTNFSLCAKPEMTFQAIVNETKRCGLTDIALTDHSDNWMHDHTINQNEVLKKQRDSLHTDLRIRIGAELSLFGIGKYDRTPEEMASMEYRLISQNHYHVKFWEHPEDRSPAGYARHMTACLEKLFTTDYADCIAHPLSIKHLDMVADCEKIYDCFTDDRLADLLAKGEAAGCAWELHKYSILTYPQFYRRFFHVGKEVGCHFTFATDAHRLCDIDTAPVAQAYKKILL